MSGLYVACGFSLVRIVFVYGHTYFRIVRCVWTLLSLNTNTDMNLYCAVNTLRLGYKHKSVNVVQEIVVFVVRSV
jgi:hypothetical protein